MNQFNQNNTVLRVCIDQEKNRSFLGRVFSQRFSQPVSFSDIGGFLLQLDEILDMQNFPQAFQRTRSFQPLSPLSNVAVEVPGQGLSAQAVSQARGELFTCEVQIVTRRNASWQGVIDWLDGEQPQPFSSALELIQLIDGRVESTPR